VKPRREGKDVSGKNCEMKERKREGNREGERGREVICPIQSKEIGRRYQ
jgi:hypothetical protein